MLLQAPVIVTQAEEVGKSRGRVGRERMRRRGDNPPWEMNSLIWSSVKLLLRIESTKCTLGEMKGVLLNITWFSLKRHSRAGRHALLAERPASARL